MRHTLCWSVVFAIPLEVGGVDFFFHTMVVILLYVDNVGLLSYEEQVYKDFEISYMIFALGQFM
jgi:hypothetical protein